MSRSCGLDHPSLATKEGQDGNDNRHRTGHQGHRQTVVMPMMLGD